MWDVAVRFVQRRWFLIVLGSFLAAGFRFPHELTPLVESLPRRALVAVVLFLMAWPIDASVIWRVIRRPTALALTLAIAYGLLPLVAWAISRGLRPDLAVGLLIAAAIPSTMASAAVWTRRAGGNDAVALLGTLTTNLLCFVVTPLWLARTTGAQVSIDVTEMMAELGVVMVLPMILAQVTRLWEPMRIWATAAKTPLGVLAQCGILTMVLVGAVRAGAELSVEPGAMDLASTAAMLAAVTAVHLSMLWTGHALGWLIGLPRGDRIAVGFSGSQKTLMIGLEVALRYFPAMPLAALPMIAYHVLQLLLDTLIADWLRLRAPRESAERARVE